MASRTATRNQAFFSWAPSVLGLMVLPMGEPERTSEGQDLLHKRVVFNAPFTGPIMDPGALERAKCLGGLRNPVRAVPLFSVHLLAGPVSKHREKGTRGHGRRPSEVSGSSYAVGPAHRSLMCFVGYWEKHISFWKICATDLRGGL